MSLHSGFGCPVTIPTQIPLDQDGISPKSPSIYSNDVFTYGIHLTVPFELLRQEQNRMIVCVSYYNVRVIAITGGGASGLKVTGLIPSRETFR
ncbi:hypothetical protein PoB_003261100 [Plakobranchus ocellatus]|uniref:Uncharacterized protein n=1 Tax=Plakobranchus ocellatus TaxID=259542 RepID=A0AAV4AHL4_9GAST|nr:hypothetical protein PoB_003261100 [Plakobranchus ocellatus]